MSGQDLFVVFSLYAFCGLSLYAFCVFCIGRLEREIIGLKLRVADLDRDLTALEGTLTGDGR